MLVNLSGGLEVTDDGQSVNLGSPKSKAVFAALALSANRPVSVARIVELVWGQDAPRTAEKTLQSYVTRLRTALGEDRIARVGDAYCLTLDPSGVDLIEFERLLDAGTAEHRSAALALWNGTPLAGVSTPAMEPIVSRLVERYLAAMEVSLEDDIDEGRSAEAIAPLTELTSLYPLRERLWALLMTALYASGRQADALRSYAEARDHLVEGLGLEPGAELQALERRILDRDETLRHSVGEVESGPAVATFLFTDLVDSTGMWDRRPNDMEVALAQHDAIISAAVTRNGGALFKHTGDGVLASFDQASDAVQAAARAQIDLQSVNLGDEEFGVKMALSTGRAQRRDADWFGPPLNVAARLLDQAQSSQILLAGSTFDSLDNALDSAITTSDLGLVSLRGLSRPERIYQLVHPALPRTFKPLRSIASERGQLHPRFPPALEYAHGVPFVGRAADQLAIEDAWKQTVEHNEPHFVLIAGEPGVGKTRLAASAAKLLHDQHGATVIYGRSIENHPTPFRPFSEALAAYALMNEDSALRTHLGSRPGLVASVVPQLVDRFPDLDRRASDDVDPLDIYDAVASFLRHASAEPLVLVIDDLQWADHASIDLLSHLVRTIVDGRLLVVCTYRDVEVDRMHPLSAALADLRRSERVSRLSLHGVDSAEAVALTEAVLGHSLTEAGQQLAIGAGKDAGGNPFFLQELLHYFMDSGVLYRHQGRWTADASADVQAAIPEGIREMVGRRLNQLSEEGNTLLRSASALDGEIDVDLLIDVGGIEEEVALDLLDEALQFGILVDSATTGQYEFSHTLIRQALYHELSAARRLRLHRKIAEALVKRGRFDEGSVSAIARHYLAAATSADPDRIAHWVNLASRNDRERGAFEEAASVISEALEIIDGAIDTDQEIRLRSSLTAAQGLFDLEASAASLAEVSMLAPEAGHEARAEAAVTISRSVVSLSMLGAESQLLRMLLAATDPERLEAAPRLALLVERLVQDAGDVDEIIAGLGQMDDATLARVLNSVAARAVMTREQLVGLRDHARLSLTEPTRLRFSHALHELDQIVGTMVWEKIEPPPAAPDVTIRRRVEGQAGLNYLVRLVRRGEGTASEDESVRIRKLLPPIWLEAHRRWLAFERGVSEIGEPWLPPFDRGAARILQTPFGLLPYLRGPNLDRQLITGLARRHHDLNALIVLAQAAAEVQATDLADDLWAKLLPARGLNLFFSGMSQVSPVDFTLGLIAQLRGDNETAIELQRAALERAISAQLVLDQAYVATRLVQLLLGRSQSGDQEEALVAAEQALEALVGTGYQRHIDQLERAVTSIVAN